MEFKDILSRGGKKSGAAFTLLIILYILISFAIQLFALTAFGEGSVFYVAFCSLASVIAIIITVILFSKGTRRKINDLTGYKSFKPIYLLFAVMISAGMFFGFGFVNQKVAEIFSSWGLNVSGTEIPLYNIGSLILFIIILAVFPAVIEEAFFRGLVLDGIKGIKAFYAVICISVVFALYHCSATQFFYQLIYGGLLTVLAVKSGSVIPAAVAHFINNFTVIILTYFSVSVDFLYQPLFIAAGIAVTAAALILTILYGRKKNYENKELQPEKTDEKNNVQNGGKNTIKEFFIYACPGMVFCLIMAVSALLV